MTSTYFNFQPSHLLVDLNEDHQVITTDHNQQHLALKLHHASSPPFLNSSQDQAGYYFMGSHHSPDYQEVDNFGTYCDGSPYDHRVEESKIDGNALKFSIWKKEEQSENGSASVKWMSSKMRLMKKMMIKPDQINGAEASMICKNVVKHEDWKQSSSSYPVETENTSSSPNNNNTIRVCADCNTTKTPLWRSGPLGPKSLCNACGIRQRKARRAMAAAAAAAAASGGAHNLGTTAPTMKNSGKVLHKEKGSNSGFGLQQKKRSKITTAPSRDQKKPCFEEFALNLTKKLSLHQVFPQEEQEAAILLMALSCGLVHG